MLSGCDSERLWTNPQFQWNNKNVMLPLEYSFTPFSNDKVISK